VYPITSGLRDNESFKTSQTKLNEWLGQINVALDFSDEPQNALVVMGGGTEALALEAVKQVGAPVLLITHPWGNSLPAAIETKARLDRDGIPAALVFIDGTEASNRRSVPIIQAFSALVNLHKRRLGVIGEPSDWLVASRDNQLARDLGVQLVRVDMNRVLAKLENSQELTERYWQGAAERREPSQADLLTTTGFYGGLKHIIAEEKLDAVTVRCFDLVQQHQTSGCIALAELLNSGIIATCEGDIYSALTMMLGKEMTGDIPFMANIARVAPREILLAHCTIAPKLTREYTLRSHYESGLGVGIAGKYKEDHITLSRLGGGRRFFAASGKVLPCEFEEGLCRTQIRMEMEDTSYFFDRPLGGHHMVWPGDTLGGWQALKAFGWEQV
jgi:L-fucose isomerase-like protein